MEDEEYMKKTNEIIGLCTGMSAQQLIELQADIEDLVSAQLDEEEEEKK